MNSFSNRTPIRTICLCDSEGGRASPCWGHLHKFPMQKKGTLEGLVKSFNKFLLTWCQENADHTEIQENRTPKENTKKKQKTPSLKPYARLCTDFGTFSLTALHCVRILSTVRSLELIHTPGHSETNPPLPIIFN